jgi:hypothetical protein
MAKASAVGSNDEKHMRAFGSPQEKATLEHRTQRWSCTSGSETPGRYNIWPAGQVILASQSA